MADIRIDQDDDDEEFDRPRRRRADDFDDDDDYDDRPRRRRSPSNAMDDPAMRFVLPVNTSAMAIIAGYLGLISVLCVPAPFALITGIIALRQLKQDPKLHGHGRAAFGIVMGALGTLPLPFLAIALIKA